MRGEMGRAMGQGLAQGAEAPIPVWRQTGSPSFLTSLPISQPVSALGLPWVEMGVPCSFSLKGDY